MAVAEYLVANRKDAGMPGPQGPSGPAGVTSARGETLPPGSEVEVELHDRVLTVRAPRGDKGDKGETGATGAQGPKGAKGEPGPQGPQGERGPQGETGAQGPQGVQGPKGERGPQGETGAQGPQGVQGPKGDKGDGLRIDYTAASSGELPTSGVTEGQTGIVNGELFVWDGSQWSSQGQMQGAKGEPGPQGPQGERGPEGPAGADGVTPSITMSATVGNTVGTPSVQVVKGGTAAAPSFAFAFSNLKGETGATGAQGPQGEPGPQGPQGPQGAGLQSVAHDATLTGDGTSGAPLGVADTIARKSDLEQKINALEIGGTNLIKGSKPYGKSGFFKRFNSVTDNEYGELTLQSTTTSPSYPYVTLDYSDTFTFDKTDIVKGDKYVISYDVMMLERTYTASSTFTESWIGIRHDGGNWSGLIKYDGIKDDFLNAPLNEWAHFEHSITANAWDGTTNVSSRIQLGTMSVGKFRFRMRNVKLEKGTKATAWSPAPEDFDGKLTRGLQSESSEREKQDNLLEDAISGKIAASNVKAGAGIATSVSGNDVTVSASPDTINVTFEASLFKSGLSARKSVAGLGSVNMISPDADAGNVAAIRAAGPVLAQDHGDDSSIPKGMVQLTVATAPTADMDFVITVLRSEA